MDDDWGYPYDLGNLQMARPPVNDTRRMQLRECAESDVKGLLNSCPSGVLDDTKQPKAQAKAQNQGKGNHCREHWAEFNDYHHSHIFIQNNDEVKDHEAGQLDPRTARECHPSQTTVGAISDMGQMSSCPARHDHLIDLGCVVAKAPKWCPDG